jgi:hypothetical protein
MSGTACTVSGLCAALSGLRRMARLLPRAFPWAFLLRDLRAECGASHKRPLSTSQGSRGSRARTPCQVPLPRTFFCSDGELACRHDGPTTPFPVFGVRRRHRRIRQKVVRNRRGNGAKKKLNGVCDSAARRYPPRRPSPTTGEGARRAGSLPPCGGRLGWGVLDCTIAHADIGWQTSPENDLCRLVRQGSAPAGPVSHGPPSLPASSTASLAGRDRRGPP